jgi:aminomethyltransferase
MSAQLPEQLSRTPLFDLHVKLGARMVPFAGYEMPVQYPLGVMKEHLHTRAHAGLFDVSHMGQVELHGAEAASALESLVPVDVIGLPAGKQRYALFTNEQGGILDDLMIFNTGTYLHLVVNAACKEQDFALLQSKIGSRCEVKVRDDLALLALQGPGAEAALKSIASGELPQTFMQGARVKLAGIDCLVTRSGYTGEDGFEISVPNAQCEALANALLAAPNVQPIGLGARDSLRLEAGLCLYGHDLDQTTTPVEGALTWAMQKVRCTGGARAGGFPGADVILAQLDDPLTVKRKRVGLKPDGRAPIREGVELQNENGEKIGVVTSGGFAPSLNAPIVMGYVDSAYSSTDTKIYAMLRGNRAMVTVAAMPFAPHQYKRA